MHIHQENAVNNVNFDRRASVWLVALAASLACLVGSAQVLGAAPWVAPWEPHSVTVRFGDLDIRTSAGAAALYHRIEAAARVTCGYEDHPLVRPPYAQRCSSIAVSAAVASVNSPLLSAIHAARRGSSSTAMLDE
jgi:UrcA family protein